MRFAIAVQYSSIMFILLDFAYPLEFSRQKMDIYKEKVKAMFYHAYNGYLRHAYPYDELKPITCTGVDTWGSFSLTLIDALDTLVVLGNYTEFQRAADLVLDRIDFDADVNVSVFETNIRVVGGLLSAHMLSKVGGLPLEDGWPCSGPLLRLAERVANKLMPAFNTYTGMPYGTVNLRRGLHRWETPITCVAGVGTYLLEFATLSRLTGSPRLERVAMKALMELWKYRSGIGLVGNHIDVQTGAWTATDAGIGAGVDSYFEYLVKGAIMFNKPELMRQFREYQQAINTYVKQEDWFVWVTMTKGQVTLPVFQSLEAFWPGLLTLVGDVDSAMRIMMNYYQVLKQYGFTPEFYNFPSMEAVSKRSGYPLRPELAESLMYLYRATEDPLLLQIGVELIEAIEHSAKTPCGYATVHDVQYHVIEDRMESFFLSETTKYLYLLFDPDNFVHNPGLKGDVINTPHGKCVVNSGGYIFNTEAHILDPAAVYCCSKRRHEDVKILANFEDNLNLLSLFGLEEEENAEEEDPIGDMFKEEAEEMVNSAMESDRRKASADVEYEVDGDGERRKLFDENNGRPSATVDAAEVVASRKDEPSDSKDQFLLNSLNQLVEQWSELFKLAAKTVKTNEAHQQQCQKESAAPVHEDSVCRRIDQSAGSPAFSALLKYMYGKGEEEDSLRERCWQAIEDAKDSSAAATDSSPDEQYSYKEPDYDSLTGLDEAEDIPVELTKTKPLKFNYTELIGLQNALMSCPVLPFSFRVTALGEVMPAR